MRNLTATRGAVLAGLAVLGTLVWTIQSDGGAGGITAAGTLSGEGGDAMTPVMVKLLHDDSASLEPDTGSYTNVDLDQGIADFVGTAPGTFATDFAVSERPLTSAEAATAAKNRRSFAYVPFAASPVALVTLVPNPSYQGSATISPSQFCQHIPLDLSQLDGIYGVATPPYTNWSDSRLNCTTNPSTQGQAEAFTRWGNLDPTMENYAMMSLLDSTSASQSAFAAGLTAAKAGGQSSTSDPTPTEGWPYNEDAVPGGDQFVLGKILNLDPRTATPSDNAASIALGAIFPVASTWTGAPLGVPWDVPTAAVQNAAGSFVTPSAAAAEAAEADATFTTTTDPTTSNLVTFNASSTDTTAYNNYLMLQSYFVVPTNGLSADKALALAQFIRFAVGSKGQADIASFGAAPATPKMVAADLLVAEELDAEAASAPGATTTTTTATTATGSPSSSATAAASPGGSPTSAAATGNSGSSPTGDTLATTGGDPLPLLGVGVACLVLGVAGRSALRRRRRRA
jgi:ABC-type phosphate transport system substrate-binding protein